MPSWVQPHHLTLLTILWSLLVLLTDWLARFDRRYLIASSAAIVLQYLTDATDGKLGIARGAGLHRWGHYVDHFLDYMFTAAILVGYGFLLPPSANHLITVAVVIAGGFMVSAFLKHGASGDLPLSVGGVGPTEIRLLFVAINVFVLAVRRQSFVALVPCGLGTAGIVLCLVVYRTQRDLRALDQSHRDPPVDKTQ